MKTKFAVFAVLGVSILGLVWFRLHQEPQAFWVPLSSTTLEDPSKILVLKGLENSKMRLTFKIDPAIASKRKVSETVSKDFKSIVNETNFQANDEFLSRWTIETPGRILEVAKDRLVVEVKINSGAFVFIKYDSQDVALIVCAGDPEVDGLISKLPRNSPFHATLGAVNGHNLTLETISL